MGQIDCRVCGHNFTSQITHLTEPADLYCEWIDACEKANEEEASRMLHSRKGNIESTAGYSKSETLSQY